MAGFALVMHERCRVLFFPVVVVLLLGGMASASARALTSPARSYAPQHQIEFSAYPVEKDLLPPEMRNGLFVANNPVNLWDPLGLETAVQIGMGTGATRNPFGHSAAATSGQGVHSFGTGTPPGSSFSDYMNSQAAYRDSMLYVLPTTPEQEKTINDYLNGLTDKLPKVPGKDSGDNCASRTNEALKKAGLDVGENGTPAELQRALEKMVNDGNALRFSVPKGSTPSNAWQTFNPR